MEAPVLRDLTSPAAGSRAALAHARTRPPVCTRPSVRPPRQRRRATEDTGGKGEGSCLQAAEFWAVRGEALEARIDGSTEARKHGSAEARRRRRRRRSRWIAAAEDDGGLMLFHGPLGHNQPALALIILFPCSETSNFFLLRFALGPAVAVLESEFRADHESGLRIEQSPSQGVTTKVQSEHQLQVLKSAAGWLLFGWLRPVFS
jgi:hypothetical protein